MPVSSQIIQRTILHDIRKVFDFLGPVSCFTVFPYTYIPCPTQWLGKYKNTAGSFPDILRIRLLIITRAHWQRFSCFCEKLIWLFVMMDGIEGHEVWQHANINEQGLATTRLFTDVSKGNIIIALPHDQHVNINADQRQYDARAQTPIKNIEVNSTILSNNGVPQDKVNEAVSRAKEQANKSMNKGD